MGWFKRTKRESVAEPFDANAQLLRTLLELERARLETHSTLEQKRAELELKRAEMELHDLERIGEAKRKDQLFAERLREVKREAMAKARAAKKEKAAQPQLNLNGMAPCEECLAAAEGRTPSHASDLIRHAIEKHAQRFFGAQN